MKQKYVWLVEHGCYSDYRVVGVYTKYADALYVATQIGGEVDKRILNGGLDVLNKGLLRYRVLMLYDGTVESANSEQMTTSNINSETQVTVWKRSVIPYWVDRNLGIDVLDVQVWTKTVKQAVKIANEYRTQWIALGRWKT